MRSVSFKTVAYSITLQSELPSILSPGSSGVHGNFDRGGGGGFSKFNWGQRAERTGIWRWWSLSHGFRSICKWVKPAFLLGCYGCICYGISNSAQLCQNFGISVGFEPPSPLSTIGTPLPGSTPEKDRHVSCACPTRNTACNVFVTAISCREFEVCFSSVIE
jgi:hypothetical protein